MTEKGLFVNGKRGVKMYCNILTPLHVYSACCYRLICISSWSISSVVVMILELA